MSDAKKSSHPVGRDEKVSPSVQPFSRTFLRRFFHHLENSLTKTFIKPHPNRPLSQDESFCVAFFKKRPGCGAAPHKTLFLVLFAAPYSKRTEKIFSMSHLLIHSVLFLGYVAARKSTKKNGDKRGVAPNPSRFLKKATQKLS